MSSWESRCGAVIVVREAEESVTALTRDGFVVAVVVEEEVDVKSLVAKGGWDTQWRLAGALSEWCWCCWWRDNVEVVVDDGGGVAVITSEKWRDEGDKVRS